MNNKLSYLLQHRVKRKKGDTAQLAAQLAPLEEQKSPEQDHSGQGASQGGATQEYGAIVVGNENLRLSGDLMEGSPAKGFLGMEPVVIVILIFMLAFIVFVAWQISLMPSE